jgi:hypothetical protein
MANTKYAFTFSTQPLDGKSGKGKDTFRTSDFIYGRVDLPASVKDFFSTDNSNTSTHPQSVLLFKIEALAEDGTVMGEVAKRYFKPAADELKNKYLAFDVSPEPSQATLQLSMLPQFDLGIFSTQFARLFDQSAYYGRVPAFEDGKTYTIKVTLSRWVIDPQSGYPKYGEDTECSGTFQLQYRQADVATLLKLLPESDRLVKDNSRKQAAEERGLPEEWNLKSAKIGSGETEEELIDLFLSQEAKKTEVIKLVALPAEGKWVTYRDEKVAYEKILFRWFNQTLVFFYQREGKYFCAKGGVRQDYQGNNTYGDSYLKWEEKTDIAARYIEEAMNKKQSTSKKK